MKPPPSPSKLDPITEHAVRGAVFGLAMGIALTLVAHEPRQYLFFAALGGLLGGVLWGVLVRLLKLRRK